MFEDFILLSSNHISSIFQFKPKRIVGSIMRKKISVIEMKRWSTRFDQKEENFTTKRVKLIIIFIYLSCEDFFKILSLAFLLDSPIKKTLHFEHFILYTTPFES
ncbi:hypothetical protein BpHYR1_052081 [Brachionus plicatilis]|uniref:Uncharacterized protein n=1 Tax=Brachionus plicatilis TaxID=10195 RepID=A0A3M7R8F8_BRAPC|nr:hypothetical protein BpHYR1_052081 [Brachionus plicatilis]